MYSYDRRDWVLREAARRNAWLQTQKMAAAITTPAWDRSLASVLDTVTALKKQVERFGGIENALQQGHGSTINQQVTELASVIRTLQRRLGG
jgi:hypothetical protein